MKKILLTLTGFIVTLLSMAQAPNLMNYQGVARNAVGNVLPNQPVALRLSILNGGPTGGAVYSETRAVTTNAFGLFNVVVGSPGATNVTGTIAGINWSATGAGSGTKFLQVEIDPVGGANFVNVGATQLVSVPYAVYAGTAAGAPPTGIAGGDLTGTYPNPLLKLPFIRAQSDAGPLFQITNTGAGSALEGLNTGTGRGGYFVVNNAANTSDAIRAETNGSGASWGIRAISSGTNGAGLFQQTNATNTSNNLQSTQAGLGRSGFFTSANAANTANAVEINVAGGGAGLASVTTGTGPSAIFNNTNAANVAQSVLIDNANLTSVGFGNGSFLARRGAISANTFLYINVPSAASGISSTGIGVQGTSETVFGVAGLTFSGTGVQAVAVGTGTSLVATSNGTGISANINNTNAANISNTTLIDNANTSAVGFGNGSLLARRGATSANTFLYTGVPSGMSGIGSNGIGVQGTSETFFGVAGLTFAGTGVQAIAVGAGTALVATSPGTGISANINNTNAANISNTALIDNANTSAVAFGNGSLLARRGVVSANTFLYTGVPSGMSGVSSTGIGVQGTSETTFGVAGLTFNGVGVQAVSINTGGALVANASGTGGISGDFNNSNAANLANAIRAVNVNATAGQTNSATGGGNAIFGRKGAGLGTSITNPTGVYGSSSAANGIGITGVTLTNLGVFGAAIQTGAAVVGQTFGVGGTALFGVGISSPTSFALVTNGPLQLQGQGAALGNVLTSDALGNATWQASAARKAGISIRGFTAALVIPTGVFTPVTQWAQIDNEDGGANYNAGTGEYTIPVTGVYQVNCSVAWSAGINSNDMRIEMEVNGLHETSTLNQSGAGGGYTYQNLSYSKRFTAGERIRILLLQTSGANQSTLGFAAENSLSIQYLHN